MTVLANKYFATFTVLDCRATLAMTEFLMLCEAGAKDVQQSVDSL
jgi:hypothetical protein